MEISRRKFLELSGVAAAGVMGAGALAGCSGGSSSSSSAGSGSKTVEANLADMSWDDILAEAKGETVSFLAWGSEGADAFVQEWWKHIQEYVSKNYDIDLVLTEDVLAEEEKIATDASNGTTATYDMFWGLGSNLAKTKALYGNQWAAKLPNRKYLDMDNEFNTFDGIAKIEDNLVPFQGLNPSMVYSADLWDRDLAWDASNGAVNGLFHNFTELAQWVKKYPGKFTYMDLTGKGAFHGIAFVKAVLAELTDNGSGGWKAVYDEADDAKTRRTKILAHIQDWYTWSTSSEASEDAFRTKAAYVWAYLNEIKPNLLQGDGNALYVPTAPEMMSYVMSGDLACTFTTCTSVSKRVASAPGNYMPNPSIYMLQTSIGSWDYAMITNNSAAKAASMVVANAMIEPELQIYAYDETGNGYNVDYNKLDADQKKSLDSAIEAAGTLSPSATMIADNSYTDMLGSLASWIPTSWDTLVNKA